MVAYCVVRGEPITRAGNPYKGARIRAELRQAAIEVSPVAAVVRFRHARVASRGRFRIRLRFFVVALFVRLFRRDE